MIEGNLKDQLTISINNDINVYFCHSYCTWEKDVVEHFNSMIRKIYLKGFDFTLVSQKQKLIKLMEFIMKV